MFHLYGLIVGLAIVVGWHVAERIEQKVGKVLPWVLLGGLVGARLYHVTHLWEYYAQNLGQIFFIWEGGLGIFGGIIGGVITLRLLTKETQTFWQNLGAIVVALPLSQAIGRWGNLANNELWGRSHAPLFLYESILDLGLFVILWSRRGQAPERRVAIYLLGYGLIRLLLEPMKPEAWRVGYVVAGMMVGTGLFLWYKSYTLIKHRLEVPHGRR